MLKSFLQIAGALLLVLVLALVIGRFIFQRAVARKIAITSPNGIASLEKIRLGGAEQWILIRGWNRSNPLLLFLHSGPGFPEMPFSHLNAELEKHFVVVQWDQRGAGKSYPAPSDSMRVEKFVEDTHELSVRLLQRFHAHKLFLVGHSWGSLVGALTASRYPEMFWAYVGISQFADAPQSEKLMYQFVLEAAERNSNAKALQELHDFGPPPYQSMSRFNTMKDWVEKFGVPEKISRWKLGRLALGSPVYSWADLVRIPLGANASFKQLWRQVFYEMDLFRDAPRIEVPTYFFEGRHDRLVTTSAAMAERYFQALDAPRGKELIWFENSAHWPQLEEPEKYRDLLVNWVLKETGESSVPVRQ